MAWQITWSFTRSRSLGGCPRAHFLRYHSLHVRGLEDAPYLARLVSPEILAGDAIDYTARKLALHLARGESLPSEERVVEVGLRRFDERVLNGPRHTYLLLNGIEILPCGELSALHSQYYGYELPLGRRTPDLRDEAKRKLRNLAHCGLVQRLASLPTGSVELPREGKPRPTHIAGIVLYTKPDLFIRDQGVTTIVDWKAGKDGGRARCDARRQLSIYAAVEAAASRTNLESVQVQAAFLNEAPDWRPDPIQPVEIDQIVETAKHDLAEEEEFRAKAGKCRQGSADWRREFVTKGGERICSSCPFLELCEEGRETAYQRRSSGAYAI